MGEQALDPALVGGDEQTVVDVGLDPLEFGLLLLDLPLGGDDVGLGVFEIGERALVGGVGGVVVLLRSRVFGEHLLLPVELQLGAVERGLLLLDRGLGHREFALGDLDLRLGRVALRFEHVGLHLDEFVADPDEIALLDHHLVDAAGELGGNVDLGGFEPPVAAVELRMRELLIDLILVVCVPGDSRGGGDDDDDGYGSFHILPFPV